MIIIDYNWFIVKICQDNLDGYDGPRVNMTPHVLVTWAGFKSDCFREVPSLPASPPQAAPGYLRAFGAQKTTRKPVNVEEPILNCFPFWCLYPTCYGLQMIRSSFEQEAQDESTDKCCEALHRRLVGKTAWIGTITALIHGKKSVIEWCEQNMLVFGGKFGIA